MAINVLVPGGHGSASVSVSEGVATITATPDAGYQLDSVSATSGGELLEVVDMQFDVPEGDVDVTVTFAQEDAPAVQEGQYFVDATYSNGEVRFEVGGETVVAAYPGDTVRVLASPFVGYRLDSITGVDMTGDTFTMPEANVSLAISFVLADYSITCEEGIEADVYTAHVDDEVTVAATSVEEGEVFLGLIALTEIGATAQTLESYMAFDMPPFDVTVRQMTAEEREAYAHATDEEGDTGEGDEQPADPSDVDDRIDRDTGTYPSDTVPDPSITPFTPEEADDGVPGESQTNPDPDTPDIVPTPTYHTETRYNDEIIADFSAEAIADYKLLNAIAIAVYEDGTSEQVSWDDVSDPAHVADVMVNEAAAVANAINQHFWHRSTDPDHDGAGTGAFVTDEQQEDFLEAIAHDVQPTTNRPLHNLIMNSQGILLRAAKRIRAAFLPSGVAFYDGQGNAASNIVARFGSDGAQVGKDGNSVSISSNGMTITNNNAEVMRVYSDDVYSGENTIVFKGSDITSKAGGTMVSVGMNAAPDESTEYATESRAHVGASASGNSVRAICYSNETGSSFTVEHDYGEGYVTALESFMDEYGSISYDIGDPPAFRDALDLGLLALKDTLDASDIPSLPYLPLSGGTLTGQLDGTAAVFSGNVEGNQLTFGNGVAGTRQYLVAKTPGRNGNILWAGGGKLSDGDANGTVVGLGAGALTIVGGGEYAMNRYNLGDLKDSDERLYLGSDNAIYFESAANTIANRKRMSFNSSGNLFIDADGNQGYRVKYPIAAESLEDNFTAQVLNTTNVNDKREGLYLQATWNKAGNNFADFGAQRYVGDTQYYHWMRLGFRNDNTPYVTLQHPDEWRKALGLGGLALDTANQGGAVNCNDLPSGIHYVTSSGTNIPTSFGGMCICAKYSSNVVQMFVENSSVVRVYVRRYIGTSWTAWRQVG